MKILIIDDVHPLLTDGLIEDGHEVDYLPNMTREELKSVINQYEGLIVRSKTNIDRDVLSHISNLSFIGRAGAGLDNIDTAYCDEMKIVYFNSGEANSDAVGEQTIGMLLSLYANIVKSDKEVRNGIWDREGNRGRELNGSTVGIIGYGNTGKAVARKLSGFNVNVLAYDKYLTHYGDEFAIESGMNRIFEESDILSFHIPLTDETKYLGSTDFFSRFRKPITMLNLSRGEVVNLNDLITGLENGKITGAGLDVLENEKISELNGNQRIWMDYLKKSEKVVLTPHIGGWTDASYRKISSVLLRKIRGLAF